MKYSRSEGKKTTHLRPSQINIISGLARGVKLLMPAGDGVRPTIGRAREAVFSALGDLRDAVFWDMFAGSGANGCEAASRGAAQVVFWEKDAAHCRCIEENIRRTAAAGCSAKMIVSCCSAADFCGKHFPEPDVVFADPPYAASAEWFSLVVPALVKQFTEAVVIWEVPDAPGAPGEILLAGAEEYGFELKIFGGTRFFVKK